MLFNIKIFNIYKYKSLKNTISFFSYYIGVTFEFEKKNVAESIF